MVAKLAVTLSSGHPDPKVLRTLVFLRRASLLGISFISALTLLAWVVPSVDWLMPLSWSLMKANTALCILLLCFSLQLIHARRSRSLQLLSHTLAAVVAVISFATLYQSLRGINLHLDTLLARDPWSVVPGRMSPQSAIALFGLAVIILYIRARKSILS